MVRRYDPDRAVPTALLHRALQRATRAPSAGFSQGWDFLVLVDADDRDRFWRVCAEDVTAADRWLAGMMSAPALVVCLSHRDAYLDRYAEPDKGWTERDPARWPVPYWHVDTGMAALLMLLSAVDDGLAGCFFGLPGERLAAFRQAFAVPGDRSVVGVVSLGYPAEPLDRPSPGGRRRRPLGEVAHLGRFGVPLRESASRQPGDHTQPDHHRPADGA